MTFELAKYFYYLLVQEKKEAERLGRIDELKHMHTGGMWFADDGSAIRVSDRLNELNNPPNKELFKEIE